MRSIFVLSIDTFNISSSTFRTKSLVEEEDRDDSTAVISLLDVVGRDSSIDSEGIEHNVSLTESDGTEQLIESSIDDDIEHVSLFDKRTDSSSAIVVDKPTVSVKT